MQKPDYEDNFRATLKRLLAETHNLLSVQASLEALYEALVHHQTGSIILEQSFNAFIGDRLARLIRMLEDSEETASFWYLHRCERDNVAKDIDIARLKDLSSKDKLRLIRDKAFFHIDKDHVADSQAVYKRANIFASEIIWAMEAIWRTLNRLYAERFGQPYEQAHMTLPGARETFKRDLAKLLGAAGK
ncbi:MAG: hypothetical protein WCA22_04365 [Candidatus Binatus sp.]